MKAELSLEEYQRYSRHLIIPEFNLEGQQRLKKSSVLVVGAGGLGCPLLSYLAAAGVGTIGIVDYDVVDLSNLQRQVLYSVDDIGQSKAQTAAHRLKAMNPHIQVNVHEVMLSSENALDILQAYDIVADGTDNFQTRYLVNDACVLLDKVNVYASIFRYEGQVSVFNYMDAAGVRGPNYRDLFPEPPPPGMVPSCAEGGVLGVLPGIIGSMQANEVLKVASGVGEPLSGRLFLFDAFTFDNRVVTIKKQPDPYVIDKLIDYDIFCGIADSVTKTKSISVQDLKNKMAAGEDFQLLDVRDSYEREIATIGGENVPLLQITAHADQISKEKKVVVYCRSGIRSEKAILALEALGGFDNLYNLSGGILAWSKEIDSTVPAY
jgi:adenylyltransferase/sulfurtransferase